MTNFAGKKILIMQQRGWALRTGHFLAKRLAAQGCRLGAVVFKRTTLEFVTKQTDVTYDIITNYDDIVEDPWKYLAGDEITLEQVCADLQIDSVWPFVQSLREHVRSYHEKFYYGYKQAIDDEEIVAYVKAVYKNAKQTIDTFKPDVIITPNFVTMFQIFYCLYAKKFNIPMLRVSESRVRGVPIVVYDYNDGGGAFFDRFNELQSGATSSNFERAKSYIAATAEKLIQPLYADEPFRKKSLIKKMREFAAPFYHSLKYYLKPRPNRIKNFKAALDDLPPRYIIRDYFAKRRYTKLTNNFPYSTLDTVKKYIYFPLQYQPEETIDVLAPVFNNQIEVIRQIAMAAPGDYTIVVKEHPAMVGLRTPSYLEKIARTPNVKLIDYRIPSEKVIKGADLIVNLSGTTLTEAAFLRKPAIQLGNLATTKLLPNIFVHSDFTTLPSKIREALNKNLHTAEYDQTLLNYVAAAYDVSEEVDYIGIWRGVTKEKMDTLWRLYERALEYVFSKQNN